MNLAEFPLTVLSTRSNQSLKTLEFRDSVRGRNGETVERSWIITGADKFGLPTSSDDEVLLGLLKLTV
ncbi:MAG: replication initiator protein A, partial [Proteobacteria bacterium]